MTPREQDAYIATHLFGLSVLGWAYADNYDGCGWEGWSVHANSNQPPNQPVFLNKCACVSIAKADARINADFPDANWVEPKIFGHCSICLRVVPFYSENLVDAFAMEEEIAQLGLEMAYMEQFNMLSFNNYQIEGINWEDDFYRIHATPAQRATAAIAMLMATTGEPK